MNDPPSKEEIAWIASQVEDGVKGLLSPLKIELNDPAYVEHIQGKEDELSDEEYINIYHQFPDLFKKPIATNLVDVVLGFNKKELTKKFISPVAES